MSPPAKKPPLTMNQFKKAFTAVGNAGRYNRYKKNRNNYVNSFKKRGQQAPPMSMAEFRTMFQLLSNKIRHNKTASKRK